VTAHRSPAHEQRRTTLDLDVWVRRAGAVVVAAVAAYASYQHQRAFALHGGADPGSAGLWPLSVDGLLVLATAGLLKSGHHTTRRVRLAGWLAFGLGIGVSLAANIASAPTLTWQPVLVAGWPPVALLLAVELLAHRPRHRQRAETETAAESGTEIGLAPATEEPVSDRRPTAEEVMWEHYTREATRGRTPTGAELDRVAGTNNFGRAVLRRWRHAGLLAQARVLDWTPRLDSETATETSDETEAVIS
jgi:hypothetical protein